MDAREIAVKILNDVIFKKSYSNIVLNEVLKKSDLKEVDKGLVTEIVYGTLKFKYTIDEIIKSLSGRKIRDIDKEVINIIRMTIYQLRYLDKIPSFAAVNEAVNLTKKTKARRLSSFVNAILRKYLRGEDLPVYKDKISKLAFEYSFMPWMVKLILKDYGTNAENILKGLNYKPSVTVRCNISKDSRDDLISRLGELNYDVKPGEISKDAIHILKGSAIESNPLFNDGSIIVQDEAAMLVSRILNPKPGTKVLDLCAAPGGKSIHAAEIMKNEGEVIACDIYEKKLQLIEDNYKRQGITIIKTKIQDGTELCSDFVNQFDSIIVDVPCSGIGIIRKKPEIKWEKTQAELDGIVDIQRKILTNAAKYIKPNGSLIYSTCTLHKKENEENVQWFLENNDNFEVEKIGLKKSEFILRNPDKSVTLLPTQDIDGFFICKMKRIR